jgi:hypothetical protein
MEIPGARLVASPKGDPPMQGQRLIPPAGITVHGSSISTGARPTSSLVDVGVVVLGDSGSSALAPSAISLAPARPATRLQHGIHKPKSYTDSTVWYGLFTSTGEPQDHIEALSDDRWTSAMAVKCMLFIKMKHRIWF